MSSQDAVYAELNPETANLFDFHKGEIRGIVGDIRVLVAAGLKSPEQIERILNLLRESEAHVKTMENLAPQTDVALAARKAWEDLNSSVREDLQERKQHLGKKHREAVRITLRITEHC